MASKTIKVDYLARVEGEGAFKVVVRDGTVRKAELRIFEPPRFFEAFLRGRSYMEASDITARICGICPVAYQMCAVHSMEKILGIKVDGALRELRRLLYCGEWIESHVLHVYMLHAPDFLGYDSAIHMAKDHGDLVRTALRLKKIGNDIMTMVGGREIHPINVKVGGFYKVPPKRDLQSMVENLKWARDAAIDMVRFVAKLDFPDNERDYEFVSLRHDKEYPLNEGRVVSSKGIDIPVEEYDQHFKETHVEHSTALQSHIVGRGPYFVGPLARYSLNFDKLTPTAQQVAREAGLGKTCSNPFRSIIVRSVETVYAVEEALRIIGSYEQPEKPFVAAEPRAGVGCAATEAPRGLIYHRYEIAADGSIVHARIVPPTAQNQPTIEKDLTSFVADWLDLPDVELQHRCEQAIRNYDPCISCSCHFLKLDIDRA
ncbi:MAG: Ni/Fe hydrogenase subunit alpha [Alphaproteobacteria bacterium]|nr:Ni/Fe hydrogenase subunit alpha [Alphaproteobacteria bacterium]MDE2498701.1 Ni/Fe hydrogenase subunit alpha [Alphaproteobacteria bacterium]